MTSRRRTFTLAVSAGAAAAGLVSAAVAGAETAPTGSEPFLVSQIEFPMPLVQRGDRVEIGYDAQKAPDAVEVPDATGTLYVRNDLQRSFTAIPLELRKSPQRTCSDPNHVKLRAVVPPRLLVGHKLLYYAVIRNARLGVSVTVPATGARAPESAWIINGAFRVSLGTHVFGRPEAPEAVVAKAGPSEVGFGRDGLVFGPRSFDLGRDRSLWLWDSVNTRVLMWIPGRPNMVARTIRLPFNAGDFAAGPAGSLYLLRDGPPGTTFGWLTRLSAQGNARWTAKTARRPPGLVTGPGGTLYWTGSPPEDAKDEQARTCWGNYPFMPLAAAAGRPLSFAAQQQRSLSAEPLPGGMRLVRMLAVFDKDSTPHETRVALINRAGRLVRAWRVSSRTGIVAHGGSTLVGGDPVIVLEALGVRKSEYLVLRLGPKGGLRTRFSLPNGDSPRSAYGDLVITDIRVRPDGKLYQLGSAPGFGAAVYRHSVGRIDPPATAPAVAGRPR